MRVPQVMQPDHGRGILAEHPGAAVLRFAEQMREALRLPELALMIAEHDRVA